MSDSVDTVEKEARNMGLLVYAASFAGYIIPLGSIIGPLIVWLMKRDEFKFVNECGKNCLNFKLSLLIYAIVSSILAFIGIGFILLILLGLMDIICTIIAIIRAGEGIAYRYPLTINFIK
ncbi:orotate phosphoribosyltransferase [Shewanella sp. 10N.286.52.C2]|uniref:DUF4870 domain-containing protein n=1 Tax=Shewanella sp. 10N.286.52.C2 TaxID=1880838 RepID=UPI000C81EBFB|nr:DUF4870 domain-containing protein [Shewanella sp. 10N.286.52.C2]PMG29137.1 orotate phosphoribosyltransferase [Shewanella sp. 10N.286.52.C2]